MVRTAKDLTAERHTVHGLFEDVAKTSEALMGVMTHSKNWNVMSVQRREAIKMITHKLARIGAGDFTHADHWDDIGGYALLGKQDGQNDQAPTSLRAAKRKRPVKAKKPAKRVAKKVKARPAKKAARRATVARPARVVRNRPSSRKRVARPAAPVTQSEAA